jgi:hypothetical protein
MTGFYEGQGEGAQVVPHDLDAHTDVTIDLQTLVDGQVIKWNATAEQWQNLADDAGLVTINLDDITDVEAGTPTDGFALTWVAANSKWEPVAISAGAPINLDDILDVTITTVSNGDRLEYSGGNWINVDSAVATANPVTVGNGADATNAGVILNSGSLVGDVNSIDFHQNGSSVGIIDVTNDGTGNAMNIASTLAITDTLVTSNKSVSLTNAADYHVISDVTGNDAYFGYTEGFFNDMVTIGQSQSGPAAGLIITTWDGAAAHNSYFAPDGTVTLDGAVAMGGGVLPGYELTVTGSMFTSGIWIDSAFTCQAGGSFNGGLSMNNNKINGVNTPTADKDVANKKYVDDTVGAGGGVVTIADNQIITGGKTFNALIGASGGIDALNIITGGLLSVGGSFTGNVNMNGNKISNLQTPTGTNDAATKDYVDGKVVTGVQKMSFGSFSSGGAVQPGSSGDISATRTGIGAYQINFTTAASSTSGQAMTVSKFTGADVVESIVQISATQINVQFAIVGLDGVDVAFHVIRAYS